MGCGVGYEAKCRARVREADGRVREANALVLIEADEVIVRGNARTRVSRSSLTGVSVRGDELTIEHGAGEITLTLGAATAEKWRMRLEQPALKLIDKLDVAQDAKVWVWGIEDDDFLAQLHARTGRVSFGRTASECDVVFLAVERDDDLPRIERASKALGTGGALWVVHPKGPKGVPDTTVFARAKAIGLTYTKVARFSDTHTAEKLVWPRDKRGG